jgi:hypothetical protein
LIAEQDPPRYGRAAARWYGRFVVECGVDLEDARLALVALASIPWSNAAIAVLVELGSRYRVANIESALRRRGSYPRRYGPLRHRLQGVTRPEEARVGPGRVVAEVA